MYPLKRYNLVMYKYVRFSARVCGVDVMNADYKPNLFTLCIEIFLYCFMFTILYTMYTFDIETAIKNVVIVGLVLQVSKYKYLMVFKFTL